MTPHPLFDLNMKNCGIVRDGDNLSMYIDDVELKLTDEQFTTLFAVYTEMKNNFLPLKGAYVENDKLHFISIPTKQDGTDSKD